jgi:Na+-transporting NADH:ubiquinone oxidoreductase subunit NqrB
MPRYSNCSSICGSSSSGMRCRCWGQQQQSVDSPDFWLHCQSSRRSVLHASAGLETPMYTRNQTNKHVLACSNAVRGSCRVTTFQRVRKPSLVRPPLLLLLLLLLPAPATITRFQASTCSTTGRNDSQTQFEQTERQVTTSEWVPRQP